MTQFFIPSSDSLYPTGKSYSLFREIRNTFNTRQPAGQSRPLIVFRLKTPEPDQPTRRIRITSSYATISSNARFYLYILKDVSFSDGYNPNFVTTPNIGIEYDIDPPDKVRGGGGSDGDDDDDRNGLLIRAGDGSPLKTENYIYTAVGTNTSDQAEIDYNFIEFLGDDQDDPYTTWCLALVSQSTNENVSSAHINFFEER